MEECVVYVRVRRNAVETNVWVRMIHVVLSLGGKQKKKEKEKVLIKL